MLDDEFVLFSPETFVKIENNIIYTYPMKGTIDGEIDNAEQIILNDKKEMAEHFTVVDLLRNDLNTVAKNIRVNRFRYIDKVVKKVGSILQVSSEVCGDLDKGFENKLGDIIFSMLPAGSVTGSPKKSTVDIINESEFHNRNFYTGIFGYYDGENLDSAVMIRMIEKRADKFYYKSGGGITADSNLDKEYQELIDKVYVPIS